MIRYSHLVAQVLRLVVFYYLSDFFEFVATVPRSNPTRLFLNHIEICWIELTRQVSRRRWRRQIENIIAATIKLVHRVLLGQLQMVATFFIVPSGRVQRSWLFTRRHICCLFLMLFIIVYSAYFDRFWEGCKLVFILLFPCLSYWCIYHVVAGESLLLLHLALVCLCR